MLAFFHKWLIICLLVCVLSSFYFGMQAFRSEDEGIKTKFPSPEESTKVPNTKAKSILYSTPWWNGKDWFIGIGQEPFQGCPVSNCIVTDSIKDQEVHQFDAVIFHSWHLFYSGTMFPGTRSKHQRWRHSNLIQWGKLDLWTRVYINRPFV